MMTLTGSSDVSKMTAMTIRGFEEDSNLNLIQIRLGNGYPRDIGAALRRGLDPSETHDLRTENRLGVQAGFYGSFGWPYLDQLARKTGFLDGSGKVGATTIRVESVILPKLANPSQARLPHRQIAREYMNALGLISEGNSKVPLGKRHQIWKRALRQRGILEVRRMLQEDGAENTFFIGSRRTMPFAQFIGIPRQRIFEIPSHSAFDLVPQIARWILETSANKPVRLIHAAGLVGINVSLWLAQLGCKLSTADLGLIATITDWEYNASRRWANSNFAHMISNSAEILRENDCLESSAQLDVIQNYGAEKVALAYQSFSTNWKAATRFASVGRLNDAIRAGSSAVNALPPGSPAEISRATVTYWRWLAGDRGRRIDVKSEVQGPIETVAIRLFMRGEQIQPVQLYSLDAPGSDDPRLPIWEDLSSATSRRKRFKLASMPSGLKAWAARDRKFPGSGICWSLEGDNVTNYAIGYALDKMENRISIKSASR